MATGGGTPCFFDNMEWMLQNGIVVYLTLPIGMIASRLTNSHSRPLLNSGSKEELVQKLTTQLESREVFYKKAHLIVNVADFNKKNIIDLVDLLESHNHTK